MSMGVETGLSLVSSNPGIIGAVIELLDVIVFARGRTI